MKDTREITSDPFLTGHFGSIVSDKEVNNL